MSRTGTSCNRPPEHVTRFRPNPSKSHVQGHLNVHGPWLDPHRIFHVVRKKRMKSCPWFMAASCSSCLFEFSSSSFRVLFQFFSSSRSVHVLFFSFHHPLKQDTIQFLLLINTRSDPVSGRDPVIVRL